MIPLIPMIKLARHLIRPRDEKERIHKETIEGVANAIHVTASYLRKRDVDGKISNITTALDIAAEIAEKNGKAISKAGLDIADNATQEGKRIISDTTSTLYRAAETIDESGKSISKAALDIADNTTQEGKRIISGAALTLYRAGETIDETGKDIRRTALDIADKAVQEGTNIANNIISSSANVIDGITNAEQQRIKVLSPEKASALDKGPAISTDHRT